MKAAKKIFLAAAVAAALGLGASTAFAHGSYGVIVNGSAASSAGAGSKALVGAGNFGPGIGGAMQISGSEAGNVAGGQSWGNATPNSVNVGTKAYNVSNGSAFSAGTSGGIGNAGGINLGGAGASGSGASSAQAAGGYQSFIGGGRHNGD
ncbi:MAG TPA: hypothetical protein VMV50_00850 [Candidatus Paceibacterota bacterium]|nr:hypothetical protein [Candidatus Paceibacterota bacterium]